VTRVDPPNRLDVETYPEDGWLRGYFFRDEANAHKPVGERSGRAWKNIDYLRLRDAGLHLLHPGPGQAILDVGCADGATMVYCGLQGAAVYGVDLDESHVALANAALRRFGITGEARCADAVAPIFPPDHFDAAISSDFFEHITIDVKIAVLKNIYRSLKPGRPLVVKTPNLAYLKLSLLLKRLRALTRFENPAAVVIPHTPGTADPQHVGLTTRWELSRALQAAGFLNYRFYYAPLRRFGYSPVMDVLSTEIPVVRDWLSEDVICVALKPITLAHFPD
jgi:2-polyprenyl-3-methyl-5-hydroxy-6-metoxy-1,4-benzoquinol methylase